MTFKLPTEQTLIATQGLPGSGKSTWAQSVVNARNKIVRVNRDHLRLAYGFKFEPRIEDMITPVETAAIDVALLRGYTVIVDETNLNPKTMSQWNNHAIIRNVPFVVNDDFMQVSVEECVKRDAARQQSVGKDVILRMYYDYWKRQPKPTQAGHDAIICDLDGTLALLPPGMRYPEAYDRDYRKDVPNEGVRRHLIAMYNQGYRIIFVSGRDEKHRKDTEEWLSRSDVVFQMSRHLIMRKANDRRDDALVKKELFMEQILGNFNVLYVIDDRPRVVRMWRAELGLTVLDVGDGIEF